MSAPASWRDPGDWPFLLFGVGLRLWCSAVRGGEAARAEWRSWLPPGCICADVLMVGESVQPCPLHGWSTR